MKKILLTVVALGLGQITFAQDTVEATISKEAAVVKEQAQNQGTATSEIIADIPEEKKGKKCTKGEKKKCTKGEKKKCTKGEKKKCASSEKKS